MASCGATREGQTGNIVWPMSDAALPSSSRSSLMLVEAARYALLRRLAFAMRHQMVVHLQPIGMVAELLVRRLQAPAPDLAQVQDSMSKINSLSKAAAQDCRDVITWFAPEPGATLPLDAAIRECIALLRSHFSFRGITLAGEGQAMPQPVAKAAARMLLPACLLALTDTLDQQTADLTVSARAGEGAVMVDIRLTPTAGQGSVLSELAYRPLQWHEVEAIGRAEDVGVTRGEGTATLTFPVLD